MKNFIFTIGVLFICQMVFSQKLSKQIFHDDFDTNANNFPKSKVTNGRLIIISEDNSCLSSVVYFPNDFIITTKVSTTLGSTCTFKVFGFTFYLFNWENPDFVLTDHHLHQREAVYSDKKEGNKINTSNPIEIKIICNNNKEFSFYANDILLYKTTYEWSKNSDRSICYSQTTYYYSKLPVVTYAEYLYIDELFIDEAEIQKRNEEKESEIYLNTKEKKEFDNYLDKYPNGKYFSEISTLKEDNFYNLALNGFVTECDNYISKYPSGKYITQIQDLKAERIIYKSALYGSFKEYDAYLLKYPNGKYTSEIASLKAKKLYELDRQKKIKANSNKALWKMGNKLCNETSSGIICGALNQWNEDKSMVQIKIVTSPGGTYEGESLTKGNLIWVAATGKGWHICLQDEILKSSENDKSEVNQANKNPYGQVNSGKSENESTCYEYIGKKKVFNSDYWGYEIRCSKSGRKLIYFHDYWRIDDGINGSSKIYVDKNASWEVAAKSACECK